jgi:predicted cupin superfamily sugar epimerase
VSRDGDARFWIEHLSLSPHPEGGHFRETYRAGGRTDGGRSFSTAIYYLLRSHEVSALHRLRSDELFHFYAGSSLTVHVIRPDGNYEALEIGDDPDRGNVHQAVVPAGSWFGATVEEPDSFALVGCTVAPGFDFDDFEQAAGPELIALYPHHRDLIERLTVREL